MKRVFVDTSALYALLDADDRKHRLSLRTFDRLAPDAAELVTTSYLLVESHALVQRRLGMAAVVDLHREVSPLLDGAFAHDRHFSQAGVSLIR